MTQKTILITEIHQKNPDLGDGFLNYVPLLDKTHVRHVLEKTLSLYGFFLEFVVCRCDVLGHLSLA